LRALKAQSLELDRRILVWHRSSELSGRLDHIPGIGPALATELVASIADPSLSGTDFSTWIGLIPNQNSSGGKDKLATSANDTAGKAANGGCGYRTGQQDCADCVGPDDPA
jgi:transposase